jgi:hypothetical protein
MRRKRTPESIAEWFICAKWSCDRVRLSFPWRGRLKPTGFVEIYTIVCWHDCDELSLLDLVHFSDYLHWKWQWLYFDKMAKLWKTAHNCPVIWNQFIFSWLARTNGLHNTGIWRWQPPFLVDNASRKRSLRARRPNLSRPSAANTNGRSESCTMHLNSFS